MTTKPSSISLLELNEQVKEKLSSAFSKSVWVRAEISELHENYSGHAYFELIEKNHSSDSIVAKTKATCWASAFRMIQAFFTSTAGEPLAAGLKVLVLCSVEFHELYGLSLNIKDIDPSYTLGDLARKRMEIIRRLKEDGVFALNRQLAFPEAPQRIAIISSQTAAGYGDFMDQLNNNPFAYVFYTKLFPAVMQGEQSVATIIRALDKIYTYHNSFDVVVIIRGGGAVAELSSFDNYELAYTCAQFPLPIITGIGHLRDESILDMVAHIPIKTPTAVAEFLISCMDETNQNLEVVEESFVQTVNEVLLKEKNRLEQLLFHLPVLVKNKTVKMKETTRFFELTLKNKLRMFVNNKTHQLALIEKELTLSSPQYLLKKGYSITLKEGKPVKSRSELKKGDCIITHFSDGNITSVVNE